jgi:hypothetical protein
MTRPRSAPTRRITATAALLILTSFGSTASAAIVYSGLRDIPIPTTADGITLDADTGTTSTSSTPPAGWDINFFLGGFAIAASADFQPARQGTGNQDPVQRFDADTVIVSTLQYSSGETGSSTHLGASGNFQEGESGYLGFRFVTNGSAPGATPLYGWMRVTLTANNPGGIIHEWAYETTGSPITTGQVPEPSSPPLLAGIALLLRFRRRR